MMIRVVTNQIQAKNIDSFQKLYFLLFLYSHPDMLGTSQEFAERSYLGNTLLLDEIIADLHSAGLVDRTQNSYQLRNEPGVKSWLRDLVRTFEDPLLRQELVEQVRHTATLLH